MNVDDMNVLFVCAVFRKDYTDSCVRIERKFVVS
jgi:hypothetical protein